MADCYSQTSNTPQHVQLGLNGEALKAKPTIYQYDIGTILTFNITDQHGMPFDLSTATALQLTFKKPNYTTASVIPVVATEGKVKYTTIINDLDIVGTWKAQVTVTTPLGIWHSTTVKFEVNKTL